MSKLFQNISCASLVVSLVFFPLFSSAQDASTTVLASEESLVEQVLQEPVLTNIPEEEEQIPEALPPEPIPQELVPVTPEGTAGEVPGETPESPVVVLSEEVSTVDQSASSTDVLQQTVNEQESVDPNNVDEDVPVEVATSTQDVVLGDLPPTEEATTTEGIVVEEEILMPVEEETLPPSEVVVDPIPTPQEDVVEMPAPVSVMQVEVVELAPEPEYVFSVKSGKRLSTKRSIRKVEFQNSRMVTRDVIEEVTNLPTISADNTEGIMHISGACEDKYYVVLMYKDQDDYERDRASFIYNRAYECIGGTFTYSISELPPTLPNGTYYILIGKQGETGTWQPISGLTEVDIQKTEN